MKKLTVKDKIQSEKPARQSEAPRTNQKNFKFNKEQKKTQKSRKINPDAILSVNEKKVEFFSSFFKKFSQNFDEYFNISEPGGIILAVSGGSDSVAMLDIMANIASETHFKLAVAHYNHQLRGISSDNDAGFVKNLAEKYNIPFYTASGDVKTFASENSFSIEHAARTLRYRYFNQLAQNLKFDYVITAHTSDDSAETFLLNLLRGSGLTGLSGIPPKRKLSKNVELLRPFLYLTKEELKEYAVQRKLEWHEDETNSMVYYTRNKIRKELIPVLENNYKTGISEIINRTSKLIRGADDFIKSHLQRILKNIIKTHKNERFTIKVSLLNTFSDFIKGEIIQSALSSMFKLPPVPIGTVDRIVSLVDLPTGSLVDINKRYFVLRDRNDLIFAKKTTNESFLKNIEKTGAYELQSSMIELTEVKKSKVQLNENPNTEFLDYDLLPVGLTVRTWEQGDVFSPIGMSGSMKLSDFLINQKIPLIDKSKILLLTAKSEVIWVIGIRISDKFKITDDSKRFLKVELKKIK